MSHQSGPKIRRLLLGAMKVWTTTDETETATVNVTAEIVAEIEAATGTIIETTVDEAHLRVATEVVEIVAHHHHRLDHEPGLVHLHHALQVHHPTLPEQAQCEAKTAAPHAIRPQNLHTMLLQLLTTAVARFKVLQLVDVKALYRQRCFWEEIASQLTDCLSPAKSNSWFGRSKRDSSIDPRFGRMGSDLHFL